MLEELENNITNAAQRMEDERAKAEAALSAFVDTLAKQVQNWFAKRVKSWVTEQPDVTKNLGDRLSTLKKELGPETEILGEQVRLWLGPDQLWPHRAGYNDQHGSSTYGRPSEKAVNDALETRLPSFVMRLAKRYGYKDASYLGVSWNNLAPHFDTYKRSVEGFATAKTHHKNAVVAKERHEASELWEKA